MADSETAKSAVPEEEEKLPLRLLALVWLPFACGYFLSYFFRVINAMIAPELAREVGLGPADLGLLTSAYLVVFALFQFPLGLLLDRHGARRVNAALLLIAAVGAWLFAHSDSLAGLAFARGLIGLGVSAGLMASMKAFVGWFPLGRLATLNGALLAAGGLGALAATRPVEALLGISDWRGVFVLVAGTTAIVALLILLVVPEKRVAGRQETVAELMQGVRQIFSDALFWRASLLFTAVQGCFLSMQGLWTAAWLRDIAGFNREQVSATLAALAVGFILGSASIGALADRLVKRGFNMLVVMRTSLGIAITMFALVTAGWATGAAAVLFVYCFSAPGGMVVFAILSRHFPGRLSGRVNTAVNMLVFFGGFIVQWGMGVVIGLWPAEAGHYAPQGYRAALGSMLAVQAAAFAWALTWRERGGV